MYQELDKGILKETAKLAIKIGQNRKEKLQLMKEALDDGNESRVIEIAKELCGMEMENERSDSGC